VCAGKAETPGGWSGIGRSVCDFRVGVNHGAALMGHRRRTTEPRCATRGTLPCDCLGRLKMLVSASNMKILKSLFRNLLGISLFVASLANASPAQSSQTPPLMQRPAGPGAPGATSSSRMQPTGMEKNGGSMTNGVYTNSIFGFSLKPPPGWAVVPSRDPMATNPDAASNPLLKTAHVNRTLLVMTENAPMRRASERKSLQILATRLMGEQNPESAHNYLIYSEKTAKEKGMPVEYLGDPEEVTINGEKLWKITSNETVGGAPQHVEQYVVARQSILLQFFIVSPTEPGLKDLEPVIQSLQFKPMAKTATPAKRAPKKTKTTASAPAKPQ